MYWHSSVHIANNKWYWSLVGNFNWNAVRSLKLFIFVWVKQTIYTYTICLHMQAYVWPIYFIRLETLIYSSERFWGIAQSSHNIPDRMYHFINMGTMYRWNWNGIYWSNESNEFVGWLGLSLCIRCTNSMSAILSLLST